VLSAAGTACVTLGASETHPGPHAARLEISADGSWELRAQAD
jgi:hypothetical protein